MMNFKELMLSDWVGNSQSSHFEGCSRMQSSPKWQSIPKDPTLSRSEMSVRLAALSQLVTIPLNSGLEAAWLQKSLPVQACVKTNVSEPSSIDSQCCIFSSGVPWNESGIETVALGPNLASLVTFGVSRHMSSLPWGERVVAAGGGGILESAGDC